MRNTITQEAADAPPVILAFEPVADARGITEAEATLVHRAAPCRRAQFAAGRRAARSALESAGATRAAILKGAAGQPLWPSGILGSISHSDSWAVAAIVAGGCAGIGVDIEARDAAAPELAPEILAPGEPAAGTRELTWAFSAKEAAFKAVPPALQRDLTFANSWLSSGERVTMHPSAWPVPIEVPVTVCDWHTHVVSLAILPPHAI